MTDNNIGGNIGTGDAAVLALLADTARAGRGGYGGWGGGEGGFGYGFGPYTNPSALQHSVDCLGRQTTDQTQALRALFINDSLERGIGNVGQAIVNAEQRVTDRVRDNELNSLRESADLARQLAACCCETQKGFLEQALKQQECCCETQKLIVQDGQKTRDLIQDNALRAATDANNISATVGAINGAAAQNTAAIIAAIRESGGHHPH